jgi:predicted dehydrogenase
MNTAEPKLARPRGRKIRYAAVGQGYISQIAVLPAFAHALENCELVALVSDDKEKLQKLGRKYNVSKLYSYEQYDECLNSGEIDAVFIALPNHLHKDYTIRAAKAGVHVLCEKPMAVTSDECCKMMEAARTSDIKLMIAYRLHFEKSNLRAINLIRKERIGEPKIFSSVFSMQVEDKDNIRLYPRTKGGGPVYDIGVYCINAARYFFQAEPTEVSAIATHSENEKLRDVEESMSVTLRFPGARIASFVCSFGAVSSQSLRIVGTKGELSIEMPYDFQGGKTHRLKVGEEETRKKHFKARDQFAPELIYFSDCILSDREPEPNGEEGLADIRIIEAIFQSAEKGQPVHLEPFERTQRPDLSQEIERPAIEPPQLIRANDPSEKKKKKAA